MDTWNWTLGICAFGIFRHLELKKFGYLELGHLELGHLEFCSLGIRSLRTGNRSNSSLI